jgi:hypothetical protein
VSLVVAAKPVWPILRLDHPLAAGCVGAWAFTPWHGSLGAGFGDGDFSGNANYFSNNSSIGTTDRGMRCSSFDGVNLFNKVNNSASIDVGGVGESYTLCCLFRTAGSIVSPQVVVKLDTPAGKYPFNFQIAGNNANFSINDGAGHVPNPSGGLVEDGIVHRVVGVRDAVQDTVSLYVDGQIVARVTDTTTASCANGEAVYFAGGRAGLGPYFGGFLYEVRLLRRAWNPSMVAQDFLDPWGAYFSGGPDAGRDRRRARRFDNPGFPGGGGYKPGLIFASRM